MRSELIDYLLSLSDIKYQKECWVNNKCPPGVVYDELDYTIHFLFDDTDLGDDPYKCIGLILKNDKEAESILKLCNKIDDIYNIYGYDLKDEDYIGKKEWLDVLKYAKEAYIIISS